MRRAGSTIVDGNEAAASVAHRLSEVIAIYPITPSSPMGELADEWSARGRTNLWGVVPRVVEMQSEGGAAGAVHGALQAGALATTFTASQGLLLMIPNMYRIAGELTPFCMHVTARALATHALSIFGDQSDVMACRQTGFALLASGSVQEAHDLACIAHAATLRARIPFLHFFDGFRTSHELARIEPLSDDDLRGMIDESLVREHRARALTPDHPVLRGSAQNPDVYFQAREAANPFYDACPQVVAETMRRFERLTGRAYGLFDYAGHPEAERVVVMMGSGAETAHETVDWLVARGERVGLVKVRLFRPFDARALLEAIPESARMVAALDRTREPGSVGEPLMLDVACALAEAGRPARVIGGRYGLGGKELTPAMIKAVFDECSSPRSRRRFSVGITDDVSRLSLDVDPTFDVEPDDVVRAVFYGLGSDGTVSANKSSIKIIGEHGEGDGRNPPWVQGYFVYDSKKAGSVTVSHLRFGPRPIRSACLIAKASFVACHQFGFLERYDVLAAAGQGAVFLLNAPFPPETVWGLLPRETQEQILDKGLRLFVIDASRVARESGMGGRINGIMQTCFFAISGVLEKDEAIAAIKASIRRTYAKKGEEIVARNFAAVDAALAHLHEVSLPERPTASRSIPPFRQAIEQQAPDFVRRVTAVMLAGQGDRLPVSAFPPDGTWPTGTAKWEKRAIAHEIPVWDPAICIQCNKCAIVCPHAAIRAGVFEPDRLAAAPASFKSTEYRGHEFRSEDHPEHRYSIQVAPEDCTGCTLCAAVCPAKDRANPRHKALDMAALAPLREAERDNYRFFLELPAPPRPSVRLDVKGSQFLEPLFEHSGACAGCGETPYIKLMTQLFGDRALVANATGCSSIYGGNLPTTPYTTDGNGRGPAWSNSLFEDNAEFGLGFRLAVDRLADQARALLAALAPRAGEVLAAGILQADQSSEQGLALQRERVAALKGKLAGLEGPEARRLETIADYLVRKSVWIVGGDGWAYDIGFGGLDHVLASGEDVNLLVLDTEVYSNTGGQQSKATPMGAAAKFASAGRASAKKDLALAAIAYGNVYVARVAFGAKDAQTVKALLEAESFPGPSLVIAFSHCIAHGYDLARGLDQQKLAVDSGHWSLFRHDPRRAVRGLPPLVLDAPAPHVDLEQYMRQETRFRMVESQDPERYRRLLAEAKREVARRDALYRRMAEAPVAGPSGKG